MMTLQEKMIPIRPLLKDYHSGNMEGEIDGVDKESVLIQLESIEKEKDWGNVGVRGCSGISALARFYEFCKKYCWLVVAPGDKPVGCFGGQLRQGIAFDPQIEAKMEPYKEIIEEDNYISEIIALSFEDNNRTFVRDVLNKLEEWKKELACVCWSVDKRIPAYYIYEKWLPKHNGKKVYETNSEVYYIISKYFDMDLKESIVKIHNYKNYFKKQKDTVSSALFSSYL